MYVETIRAKDVEQFCENTPSKIVDLRSRADFNRSHIPYAINIPYEDLDAYKQQLAADSDTIIFYCARGNISLLAAKEFSREFPGRMISVGGGYNAYRQYAKLYGIR